MTHEEVVADLVRKEIQSYRQLPRLVYQIQTKWRDDPRPRAGLIRAREFTMKDSYSLDADLEGLDKQYRAHYQAYFNIFHRCGLPAVAVGADVGMMGGFMAHEYMYLTPIGEDTLLNCDNCGYSANRQIARFRKPVPVAEEALTMQKVATPETKTIEALAKLLNVPEAKTAKAVFMVASHPAKEQGQPDTEQFVFVVIRGDMEVNETKLANAVGAKELRPAREEEIRATGAEPGYASPVGLEDVLIVVDDLIPQSPNLVAGANEVGYHLLNVNYGRDYVAHIVADIAAAGEGDACPICGHALRTTRGVEVGNIFKLGTRFSDALGATFLDAAGAQKPVIMGSYGIGIGRLLACIAEEHHDDAGLKWPISVAPYHVHLITLADEGTEARRIADDLYTALEADDIEVLYDDRDERPGVKFNDADLIGIPLRVTVGERSLAKGGVELKHRDQKDSELVPPGEIIGRLETELAFMRDALRESAVEVPFNG